MKKQVKKKKKPLPTMNELTPGQRAADIVTTVVGSWTFIIGFLVFMAIWIWLNAMAYLGEWDPYPFILLNFVLSCLAAIQAPIILMSQNRETERDRQQFKYDYTVNRKAEREVQHLLHEVSLIKKHVYDHLGVQKPVQVHRPEVPIKKGKKKK
jgi:uncharacterized membrane protein